MIGSSRVRIFKKALHSEVAQKFEFIQQNLLPESVNVRIIDILKDFQYTFELTTKKETKNN